MNITVGEFIEKKPESFKIDTCKDFNYIENINSNNEEEIAEAVDRYITLTKIDLSSCDRTLLQEELKLFFVNFIKNNDLKNQTINNNEVFTRIAFTRLAGTCKKAYLERISNSESTELLQLNKSIKQLKKEYDLLKNY